MQGSRRARVRVLGVMTAVLGAMFVVTQTVMAAVTWGSATAVAPSFSWNDGGALARSTTSSTSYLHAVFASDVIGGVPATDGGPYTSVYYTRGNPSGSTWGTPKRLNGSTTHAVSPVVIANGAKVIAAFVTLAHWDAYDPAEPRHIKMRFNTNHGASGSWTSGSFDPGTARVDRPALAAFGDGGFLLTYTDADTGEIVVVTCGDLTVGGDTGCSGSSVGTTTRLAADPADGYEGLPVIAAVGSVRAVAWLKSNDGGISAATRSTGNWSSPTTLTSAPADGLSAAAASGRFAFSWAENTGVKLKMRVSGTWQPTRTVGSASPTGTYHYVYTTAVALASSSTVGVAFAACKRTDCQATDTAGVDLRWRESSDNGATWKSAVTVAAFTASSSRRYNDFPSVVMSSATKRFVMYNTASATGSSYRVLIRVGSG